MAFKRYDKHSNNSFPTVSIGKTGQMSLNAACIEKHFKGAKSADLFYDDKLNVIGIKPYKKAAPNAFSLATHEGKGASISGRGFTRYFGIEINTLQRFIPAWNEEEELLEIHLNKPISQKDLDKITPIENKAKRKKEEEEEEGEQGIEL